MRENVDDNTQGKWKTRIRERRTETLLRWWKFNLVGAIGIGVQLALLFWLTGICHVNYLAATAAAVEAAVVHNFLWHEHFTWADRVKFSWRQSPARLARFNLANGGISILGNLVLMKALVSFGHLNYFAANLIAIALCSLTNFLVSDEWVFAGQVEPGCFRQSELKALPLSQDKHIT